MISCITNCICFFKTLLREIKELVYSIAKHIIHIILKKHIIFKIFYNFILKILINNFFKSQKRSFLVVKISFKTLPKKQGLHFRAP